MRFLRSSLVQSMFLLASVGWWPCFAGEGVARSPRGIDAELRDGWKLDPFYRKQVDVGGLPIVGSDRVTDNALAEAAWIVERMIGHRPELLRAMRENLVRVAVMAASEYTTDVPEHSRLEPKQYWDRRARGLGATPDNPTVSCGEENLLDYPGDPYPRENIFVHEFAHAIHETGLVRTDPTFDERLRAAHRSAVERGLWKNTYAATNPNEYWAEGVQAWFDDNAPPDALHNDVRTRERLKSYDPQLAALCLEVFGDKAWRYVRPVARDAEGLAHLDDYRRDSLPRFTWRDAPLGDSTRATFQTSAGDFDIELLPDRSPDAVRLFLKLALEGAYHSGTIRRDDGDSKQGVRMIASVSDRWSKQDDPARPWWVHPARGDAVTPQAGMLAVRTGGDHPGQLVIVIGDVPQAAGPEADLIPIGKIIDFPDSVKPLEESLKSGEAIDIRRVIRTH
jgi:hypothetical protein